MRVFDLIKLVCRFVTQKYFNQGRESVQCVALGIFYAYMQTADMRCLTPYMRCNGVYKSLIELLQREVGAVLLCLHAKINLL